MFCMFKLLSLFVSLFLISSPSYALKCNQILKQSLGSEVYIELMEVAHLRTMSKELTALERNRIERLIPKFLEVSTQYEEAQSEVLKLYGPSFLPRLRQKMTEMSQEFRLQNQNIANELRRYLLERGNLKFSDLEMWQDYRRASKSQALDFMKNPQTVYFGLGYFVDTHSLKAQEEWLRTRVEKSVLPGYRWAGEPLEMSMKSNFRVMTVPEKESSEYYPSSGFVAPEALGGDKINVSGLPLTPQVLSFFKRFGEEQSGHLNVNFRHFAPKRTVTEKLFLRDRVKVLSTIQSRWVEESSAYVPVLSSESTVFHGFSDAAAYTYDNGVLRVPAKLARKGTEAESREYDESQKRLRWPFRFTKPSYSNVYVLEDNMAHAEFVILPTHQEFVTALIELIHTEQ